MAVMDMADLRVRRRRDDGWPRVLRAAPALVDRWQTGSGPGSPTVGDAPACPRALMRAATQVEPGDRNHRHLSHPRTPLASQPVSARSVSVLLSAGWVIPLPGPACCTAAMDGALSEFNRLSDERAIEDLMSCCASPFWARQVVTGRPYLDVDAVTEAARAALVDLDWPEVALALAAHPRIGERPSGTGRENVWSRREQAGVDHSDGTVLERLAEANRAYEERFGRVFLIFATGRSDAEILAEAQRRLANDEVAERMVVRGELTKIVALRLERLLA